MQASSLAYSTEWLIRRVSNRACRAFHAEASSACTVEARSTLDLMKLTAASSLANTAGKVPPRLVPDSARSRITTTTWRQPLRFSARRRSLRLAFRFSGRTCPPT